MTNIDFKRNRGGTSFKKLAFSKMMQGSMHRKTPKPKYKYIVFKA